MTIFKKKLTMSIISLFSLLFLNACGSTSNATEIDPNVEYTMRIGVHTPVYTGHKSLREDQLSDNDLSEDKLEEFTSLMKDVEKELHKQIENYERYDLKTYIIQSGEYFDEDHYHKYSITREEIESLQNVHPERQAEPVTDRGALRGIGRSLHHLVVTEKNDENHHYTVIWEGNTQDVLFSRARDVDPMQTGIGNFTRGNSTKDTQSQRDMEEILLSSALQSVFDKHLD